MTLSVDRALETIARHRPEPVDAPGMQAATALIVTREQDPRALFIRRAQRDGDRWSGHAALPGGKVSPADADRIATARREAHEETGVTGLATIGALDDIKGWFRTGVVTPVVFTIPEPPPLILEPSEVADADWIPLEMLADRAARTRHPYPRLGPWKAWTVPFGETGEPLIIWGLTYRILRRFLDLCR
ncbi:CoA pyrophosphatase [Hoyosella sp. G463]|uniref:CoA pyrophosphatase n=1 Tax=Lolliginicoccus lacisalsi TaxID=2742202 RepID=A0A927J9F5_9ACTN|nr:CoA pyrophosphatase [Lolliginicoccus lacisalsi]